MEITSKEEKSSDSAPVNNDKSNNNELPTSTSPSKSDVKTTEIDITLRTHPDDDEYGDDGYEQETHAKDAKDRTVTDTKNIIIFIIIIM